MAKVGSKSPGNLPDLPDGGSVTTKGSTTVESLKPVQPKTAPPAMLPTPPMPANPLLAPGAPPDVVHAAITRVVRGHQMPGVPLVETASALPARIFNSTFDAPPAELQQHLAHLQNLRGVLGGLLQGIDQGIHKASEILKIVNAIPGIGALAAKEGIDLILAQQVLDQLAALLDQVKPPAASTADPVPAPAEPPPPAPAETPEAEK